jgi:hypothetical protein
MEDDNDYIDEMWEPYDVINHNAPSYGIESIHYGEDCPPELRAELEALCKEFEDIFSTVIREEPAHVTPMELNVDESKWYLPKNRSPPRAHSAKKRDEVITQVNFMLKWKVIRPSQAEAWSHAHLTPKPMDLWRFCVDLRNLNEACESMNWPIGLIKEILQRIGDQRPIWFAKLDMTKGYWQFALAESSKKYTAFMTSIGLYEFNRVVMGCKGAGSYFTQKMAIEVLRDLLYKILEIYMDDILLFAKTEREREYIYLI